MRFIESKTPILWITDSLVGVTQYLLGRNLDKRYSPLKKKAILMKIIAFLSHAHELLWLSSHIFQMKNFA